MPCFLVVLGLLTPRLVVAILWFFTTWFSGLFDTLLWPVLGFFLLPTTLLWYSVVQNWLGGVWGASAIIGLVIAVVLDLSPARGSRRE